MRRQLTLGWALLVAAALPASALTPTSDGRYIFVAQATPTETVTPVPFQPFSASRSVLVAGQLASGATQQSSIAADGIVAEGVALSEFPGFLISESVFDVQFDLTEGSVFTLQGTLRRSASSGISLVLERLAPSPAVLISFSQTVTLDELAGMPPGSYRLRAVATGTAGLFSQYPLYDIDFQLACSSTNPADSDGDGFVNACDDCPYAPGTGAACPTPQVPLLGPAATGLLALALLVTPAACSRARRPGRPSGRSGSR